MSVLRVFICIKKHCHSRITTDISALLHPLMTNFDGICIHDFPWPRRVLTKYSVTGDENMTIQNCKTICQGIPKN